MLHASKENSILVKFLAAYIPIYLQPFLKYSDTSVATDRSMELKMQNNKLKFTGLQFTIIIVYLWSVIVRSCISSRPDFGFRKKSIPIRTTHLQKNAIQLGLFKIFGLSLKFGQALCVDQR